MRLSKAAVCLLIYWSLSGKITVIVETLELTYLKSIWNIKVLYINNHESILIVFNKAVVLGL